MAKYLFLTQLYPSGLSGTSVKTKHALELLLQQGHQVDVVCIHHTSLLRPVVDYPAGIRIFVIEKAVFSFLNLSYALQNFGLLLSLTPFRIKKMFDARFATMVATLLASETYAAVLFDGYATLQYLPEVKKATVPMAHSAAKTPRIYIDDEDIAELMRQRWQRENNPLLKLFFCTEWWKCQHYERQLFPQVDQLWAISDQTLARLRPLIHPKTTAVVMPTIVPIFPKVFQVTGKHLVFTGLLSWLENVNGLRWFLREAWALVRAVHPRTQLIVMGQMAKPEFIAELKTYPGVVYQGFVPDLQTVYRQAAAAIAPILINCGIKIKVVTYLSYGLPVVTTPQSTQGLGGLGGVLTATTGPEFAAAVNQLLADQKLRQRLSARALQTIQRHHTAPVLEKFFKLHLPGFIFSSKNSKKSGRKSGN